MFDQLVLVHASPNFRRPSCLITTTAVLDSRSRTARTRLARWQPQKAMDQLKTLDDRCCGTLASHAKRFRASSASSETS